MLVIKEPSQTFLNFFKVATKIFSFFYYSFYILKHLFPVLKMFQKEYNSTRNYSKQTKY